MTKVLKSGYTVFDMATTILWSAFKREKILTILKLCMQTDTQKTGTKTRAGGQTYGQARIHENPVRAASVLVLEPSVPGGKQNTELFTNFK
jgi:hypothetical protein